MEMLGEGGGRQEQTQPDPFSLACLASPSRRLTSSTRGRFTCRVAPRPIMTPHSVFAHFESVTRHIYLWFLQPFEAIG